MHAMESFIGEAVARYQRLNQAATELLAEIPRLTPELIQQRCQALAEMQQRLGEDQEHFFTVMEFFGPELLETAAIGEFQRALDCSIQTLGVLHAEMLVYRRQFEGLG
jgi:hypothetical protein